MQTDEVHTRRRFGWAPRLLAVVAVALAACALAACGSSAGSSSNAAQLLDQTFSGTHVVRSGNLGLALTVQPLGSSSIKGPISFTMGGPFQSRGAGKLPASDFVITLSGIGRSGSLSLLSTSTQGYVTVQGTSYQLPQATFRRLESTFAQAASSPGTSGSKSSSGALARLGLHPRNWLRNPTVVGTETVGGASTTHIRAGVDVTALVNDLSTFLQRASSLGVSGTPGLSGGLPPATRDQIAAAIRNPIVDVWTGTADRTLRKLQIGLSVPITGQLSSATGGASSASIGFVVQYADLNQPQSIAAPTNVRPFSEFAPRLQSILQSLEGAVPSAGRYSRS